MKMPKHLLWVETQMVKAEKMMKILQLLREKGCDTPEVRAKINKQKLWHQRLYKAYSAILKDVYSNISG
jgi:RIO-like serine/threonine protein kinase